MINSEILLTAIKVATGRLVYHDVGSGEILGRLVDREASLPMFEPCWMVKQELGEDSLREFWKKAGEEITDESELTLYRITLPMSQW